ncbi:integrase arm-type DNA-binding domain-containing protein [Maritimibacter sp. UBA3975]|uniref:tyrosine-type recombinase/integrase n=1 Tax=Maritimibacter sp. UBA3975 TaxID=1946833 RepID=UPI000C09AB42|nr:integrase arm-type DNA-binding domain-containing protein [Maritimibacter sp. UBA3975]MAM63513.1 integrase [Maritimibacter sp.]|tara:strand:+ start:95292 stop:96485 length:1194 start_codon:yes stop_codon:yes gene_type:complete
MARLQNKLTNAAVKAAAPGKHSDGAGLWLYKREDGGAQWVLRYTIYSKRHEMGLGRFPDITLREAREEADKWRAVVRGGKDAIKERDRQRAVAQRNQNILADVARDAFESRKAELKGDGKAGRWFSPLELHVLPKLGKMPVSEIDQRDIRDTLAPIWHDKADTARKAMNRLSIVMRHAAALGLEVDLQATEKAKALLGKQRHKPQNIPAMAWQDVPTFYQSLNGGTISELALRLLILTAVRSFPLRHLQLDQIEGDIWTIPAEAMKGRRDATTDFRVPLSRKAQEVIAEATPFARDGFLFPGVRKGVISDATMSRFMERRGLVERPHGFRSSFRDWVAETTKTPWDVAETALGHTVGGSVERAYRRTDFLEQRRTLMERWAAKCSANASDNVMQLGG